MNTITNYTIKSELGQGGMATVYLAEDKKFLTNVAVKVLAKEFAHNENIRKRFLAEARNMFKMSHPNIIKVTDLIEEGDTVAFVMEYIEGETLKEYLERKGKLNDDEIKAIFTQMLSAVGYVHEQGLIHRDIKPSNFMISPKGQVKLLDFGIAKNTDSNSAEYTQTSTSQQMGTPMYMSPEQVNETKSVTAQSDIYSLGVVLWQMIMGQKPYDMKNLSAFHLQNKIVNEKLPKTNTTWDTVVEKATSKEIEKRYLDCSLFKTAMYNIYSKYNKKAEVVSEKTIIDNKPEKEENKKNYSNSKDQKKSINNTEFPQRSKKWLIPIVVLVLGLVVFLIYTKTIDITSIEESVKKKPGETENESLPLQISVNASSSMSPSYGYNYDPYNTIDQNISTWWSPSKSLGKDVWINYSFNQLKSISGILIHAGSHFPNFKNIGNLYWLNLRISKARVVFSNGYKEIIYLDDIDDMQKISFNKPVTCEGFRLELLNYYPSNKWNDYCISELSPIIE
jgi:serine/threonine protein kinase